MGLTLNSLYDPRWRGIKRLLGHFELEASGFNGFSLAECLRMLRNDKSP